MSILEAYAKIDVSQLYEGQVKSAIKELRDSFLTDSATGDALTTIGRNKGRPRPPTDPNNDELYRRILFALSPELPQVIKLVSYRLAEAVFGSQASLEAANLRAWQFYEVNPNELIFECPAELIAASNLNASYMHGFAGNGVATIGTSSIAVIGENAATAVASTLVGLKLYVFHGGSWVEYTIASHSYNPGTLTNTFSVAPSTFPVDILGYPTFVDIPSSSSFRGDFMAADETEEAGTPRPPVADRVYIQGSGPLDVFEYYMMNFPRAAGVVLRIEQI